MPRPVLLRSRKKKDFRLTASFPEKWRNLAYAVKTMDGRWGGNARRLIFANVQQRRVLQSTEWFWKCNIDPDRRPAPEKAFHKARD